MILEVQKFRVIYAYVVTILCYKLTAKKIGISLLRNICMVIDRVESLYAKFFVSPFFILLFFSFVRKFFLLHLSEQKRFLLKKKEK